MGAHHNETLDSIILLWLSKSTASMALAIRVFNSTEQPSMCYLLWLPWLNIKENKVVRRCKHLCQNGSCHFTHGLVVHTEQCNIFCLPQILIRKTLTDRLFLEHMAGKRGRGWEAQGALTCCCLRRCISTCSNRILAQQFLWDLELQYIITLYTAERQWKKLVHLNLDLMDPDFMDFGLIEPQNLNGQMPGNRHSIRCQVDLSSVAPALETSKH